jgi:hypothetical protein
LLNQQRFICQHQISHIHCWRAISIDIPRNAIVYNKYNLLGDVEKKKEEERHTASTTISLPSNAYFLVFIDLASTPFPLIPSRLNIPEFARYTGVNRFLFVPFLGVLVGFALGKYSGRIQCKFALWAGIGARDWLLNLIFWVASLIL